MDAGGDDEGKAVGEGESDALSGAAAATTTAAPVATAAAAAPSKPSKPPKPSKTPRPPAPQWFEFDVTFLSRMGFRMQREAAGAAVVAYVVPGEAAAEAGVKAGDRVVRFNGDYVTQFDELLGLVQQVRPRPAVERLCQPTRLSCQRFITKRCVCGSASIHNALQVVVVFIAAADNDAFSTGGTSDTLAFLHFDGAS